MTLVAEALRFTFGETVALDEVSVAVSPGEVVALVGASGSGKSTLLYCLSGLLRPHSGVVRFCDQSLSDLGDEGLSALRRNKFGFVFQFADLVPELTLTENIALPLELQKVPRRQRRARVHELLERLGLEKEAGRRPAQVSGGQVQRAAIARAVVHRPQVLFADEPTGALDSANGTLAMDLLLELARENGSSVVLVTHDSSLARRADRTIMIRDGRVDLAAPSAAGTAGAPGTAGVPIPVTNHRSRQTQHGSEPSW